MTPPRKKAGKTAAKSAARTAAYPAGETADDGADEGIDNDLDKFVRDCEPDSRFRLMRRDDELKRWVLHGVLAKEEASEEWIGRLFGGGRYWVQRLVVAAKGGDTIGGSRRFTIAGVYRPPTGELPGLGLTIAPEVHAHAPAAPGGQAITREFLDQALAGKVIDLLNQNRSNVDWSVVLAPLITGVVGIVTAIIQRPAAKPDSDLQRRLDKLEDLIEKAGKSGASPQAVGLADTVKMIRDVVSLREELGAKGEGDGENQMWTKIPQLLEAMLGRSTNGQGGEPLALQPGGPTQAEIDALPPWHRLLLHYRAQLLDAANRGIDPAFASQMISQFVPGEWQGTLIEFVQREDAIAAMCQAIPEMQHFPTFTSDLLAELRDVYVGGDDDDDDKEPEK